MNANAYFSENRTFVVQTRISTLRHLDNSKTKAGADAVLDTRPMAILTIQSRRVIRRLCATHVFHVYIPTS